MSQKIVFEDGKFVEITTTETRRAVALLPELFKAQQKPHSLLVRKILKISAYPADLVVHATGSRVYIIPLAKLPWKQYYSKKPESLYYFPSKQLVPLFQIQGPQTILDPAFKETHELKETTFFDRAAGSPFKAYLVLTFNTSGSPVQPYLFISYAGELYVPPLPNIYSDGRVCMGPTWDHDKTGPYGQDDASILTHLIQSFSTSTWNNHLVLDISRDFCALTEDRVPIMNLNPKEMVRHLTKNAPAFLGPWTPQ